MKNYIERAEGKISNIKYDPEKIVNWLIRRNDWVKNEYTPTEIGIEVFDLPLIIALKIVLPIISKLCIDGKVERGRKIGTYRAIMVRP